jgi:glycolate oxidase FAD binding subunit
MPGHDISGDLQARVRDACSSATALAVRGGGTKAFYGRVAQGEVLSVAEHDGVVAYEPTELVITARAGTRLAELESVLRKGGQMLAFEPPHFGGESTVGGAIACGLSGPRRPFVGAARDFVLGTQIINGRGEILRFGGEVMKNVAGYDVSRLMVGALGTLGVLLEISLKVLPLPVEEVTLSQQATVALALETMSRWAGFAMPLSGACFDGQQLFFRLSGAVPAVRTSREKIGGEVCADGDRLWQELREQTHGFFRGEEPLWRLSVPATTPALPLEGRWLLDWGGAQRWLRSEQPASVIQRAAAAAGGHAVLFRGGDRAGEVFQPLAEPLRGLHRNLKRAFDPNGILNPGRLYRAW